MILLRRFPDEHHCQSILINLSEKSAVMGSFWKSIFVGDCQTYFRFVSQTFVLSESGSLPLHKCVKEPHFEKTCICREIKFIIVVNVFSISCVCFKEIFSVHYGKCIQLTQNETSDKHENSVFCEHHLRQSPFKCTAQWNLF